MPWRLTGGNDGHRRASLSCLGALPITPALRTAGSDPNQTLTKGVCEEVAADCDRIEIGHVTVLVYGRFIEGDYRLPCYG
ncbi:hypothetical protein HUT17_05285 (plasmid) [Nocardiopsis flavescens]|nr:hypothetical protein HUT17_05285 [Nocardiopsis flavescens]